MCISAFTAKTGKNVATTLMISALAVTALSGCGDDDEPEGTDLVNADATSLYLISHDVYSEPFTTYLTVIPDLDEARAIDDLTDSVEFVGGGSPFGVPEAGKVYFHSNEDATVTEVVYDANGLGSPGARLSFSNLGVLNAGWGESLFVSATKAYYISRQIRAVIPWNPEAMVIDGEPISLGLDTDSGENLLIGDTFLVGEKLVIISNTADAEWLSLLGAHVSVIDTESNTLLSSTTDMRASAFSSSAVDENGDRYFGPNDNVSGQHFLTPDLAAAPMILRIRAGETEFDPTYSRSLTEELDSTLWGCCTQGPNGSIFAQGFPEDGPGVAEVEENFEFGSMPFEWYRFHTDQPVVDAEIDTTGIPYGGAIMVNGHGYLTIWDDVNSTLLRTTSPDQPTEGIQAPGFLRRIIQIR